MKIPSPVPADQYNRVPEEVHKAIRLVGVMFGRDAAIRFGRELCNPSGKYEFVGTYPDFDDVPAVLDMVTVSGMISPGELEKIIACKTEHVVRSTFRDFEKRQG